jgi:hypothetical protein
MTAAPHQMANGHLEQFVPVRKSDLLAALLQQGAFTSDGERAKFCEFCRIVASIFHHESFELLERLRNDYYYFSPEVAPHAPIGNALLTRCYDDLVRSFDKALKEANFIEVSHAEIEAAHRRRTILRVDVKAPLNDFREVRFYRRGRHTEQFEVAERFGLRRRKIEAEVYDDVVLLVAMKSQVEIGSRRELRRLQRRKIVPGSVLLKSFRNIASGDLNALFPDVRVVLSKRDKFVLGVPAIASGLPILLKLYATITVLFLVLGFYLGVAGSVRDKDMATALAALGGLVALGAFVATQWVKYQRRSLRYQTEITDNVYYRNINNNAGIFDYIIGAAEDQECKEAFLAYHFLRTAASPPTAGELESRIEGWLAETFGVDTGFNVGNALARLERFGLLKRHTGNEDERHAILPLDAALAQLHRAWDGLFDDKRPAAAE